LKTTTFLAGLTCEGLIAPFVLDGPINAECFLAYVEQILVPVLRQGDTVILDNLSSHRTKRPPAPSQAPPRLLFLLPYSPDLNPIEMAFAKSTPEPSTPSGISSDAPSTYLPLKNAPTTSVIADTIRFDRNRL
jgi:hypothetical protein